MTDQAPLPSPKASRWLGVALIVAGILAIVFPLLASIAAKLMIGWFLIFTGAAALWHAFQARGWRSALLSGLVGLLHLVAGVYLVALPLSGLIGLTVFLAILFGMQGGAELLIGVRHRPERGWVWMVASGLASMGLGLLLLLGLPGTALWALGLLVGINFVTSGASFLALGRADT